jgi:hypothetical protein
VIDADDGTTYDEAQLDDEVEAIYGYMLMLLGVV